VSTTTEPTPNTWQHHRARVANAVRSGNTEAEMEARADLKAVKLAEHIRRVVGQAPPLTDAQRDRLAALLRPTAS